MKRLKQIGLYCLLAAVLGLLLWMAFPSFWEDCTLSVITGRQTIDYRQVAVNGDGTVYAVGRQGDDWRLVRAWSTGREEGRALHRLGITDILSVSRLYACADGGAVLTVYEEKEGLYCRAYYLTPDGKAAQRIFSAPCPGGRREDVRLSGFAEEGGAVAFLVEQGGGMELYSFIPGSESAGLVVDVPARQAENALYALPDGTVATAETGGIRLREGAVALPEEVSPLRAWPVESGAVVLDGGEGALWRIHTDSGRAERLLVLGEDVIDLGVSCDGRIALLGGSGQLQVWRGGVLQERSDALYRQRWQSALVLALGALGVLAAAVLLWYAIWEVRKLQLSLMARYGVAAAVVLALLAGGAVRWVVQPHYQAQAEASAETYLRTAALSAPEPVVDPLGADWDYDEALTTRAEYIYGLWRAFGSPSVTARDVFDDVAADSPYRMAAEWAYLYNITDGIGERLFGPEDVLTDEQAFTFLYRAMRYIGREGMTLSLEEGRLYLVEPDGGRIALPALLLGEGFSRAAERALTEGTAFVRCTAEGTEIYAAFTATGGDRLNVLTAECEPYLDMAWQGARDTARLLWAAAAAALLLMLLLLTSLVSGLRRVTRGMDAIRSGAYVEVVDRGGDEVSAMADSLNTMARTLRAADAENLRRGDVYARFLPDQIAGLLGVASVEAIDKQTFASRVMTTMHVSFAFSEAVYESRSKELFDNINQVTECTARIVSARGGTILSFSHDGFDALFDPESSAPVSAAVAIRQEIISINRERSRQDRSPVRLRITLDSSEVMLGVVGDDKRMQTTAVSSSFNTARMLDALFSRFEANILCTESVERWTEGYGSRYIGKTHNGADLIRVYEIYDGDLYSVRQGKAETEQAFAEGVYTLYAGDHAAAKRIFMEIVRRNSGDGAAKYYLYLADRFEKEPPEEVSLDC